MSIDSPGPAPGAETPTTTLLPDIEVELRRWASVFWCGPDHEEDESLAELEERMMPKMLAVLISWEASVRAQALSEGRRQAEEPWERIVAKVRLAMSTPGGLRHAIHCNQGEPRCNCGLNDIRSAGPPETPRTPHQPGAANA